MSALSYNSQMLRKGSPVGTIVKFVAAFAILVVGFTGGYYSNAKLQAHNANQISKAGRNYVAAIVAGDLEGAYNSSAPSLRQAQTKDDFTNTLKDLKSNKPVFGDTETTFSSKGVTYAVLVKNLPPSATGSTDGVFTVNFANESGWKVKSVDVR